MFLKVLAQAYIVKLFRRSVPFSSVWYKTRLNLCRIDRLSPEAVCGYSERGKRSIIENIKKNTALPYFFLMTSQKGKADALPFYES